MNFKMKIKITIDFLMTILLLLLMAFQITGQEFHEWFGAGMLVLFLVHNVLNYRWYKNILKGRYRPVRVLQTVVNFAVLLSMLCLAYSGIVMSHYVFGFVSISGQMALARQMHMAASYWGFVLMSVHLGFHWGMVVGMAGKIGKDRKVPKGIPWIFRMIAIIVAGYGAVCFYKADIVSYMFLKNQFAFFDFEKTAVSVFSEYMAMMGLWGFIGYYGMKGMNRLLSEKKWQHRRKEKAMKRISIFMLVVMMALMTSACGKDSNSTSRENETGSSSWATEKQSAGQTESADVPEGFVKIQGGNFQMGSPDTENWRSDDETAHPVTVSDFYIGSCEVTQAEYQEITGKNPSNFKGEELPVENLTWYEAVSYCNARSEKEGLEKAYTIDGQNVTWNRSADGYRLPTEAEWEYACRAGTKTPFNTETSISPEESNYFGHYPYLIEENYFSQEKLDTEPGEYRETTVAVNSFSPNKWGLYNMHGNVGEWCWDYYGAYPAGEQTDPAGAETGTRRVNRGGGWNDFAKHIRSAYRASTPADRSSAAIGIRLVRNAVAMEGSIADTEKKTSGKGDGSTLIVFFSWGGNTKGIAQEIQSQTGADLFEIELVHPYSDDYDTVLDEAQRDQNEQARPEIKNHVENMDQYSTVILGYPNWWASIPMPIASFLEEYDLSGKTIVPFCSHGGGRFGQSLTAIAKLAPQSELAEGLAVSYSGGSSLSDDIAKWLEKNGVKNEDCVRNVEVAQ